MNRTTIPAEAMNLDTSYMDPSAPRSLARSLRETGFAVLVDHPVDAELVSRTYAEWAEFFERSDKDRYHFDRSTFAGFYPFRSENAKDRDVKDLKEFYHVYPWSELPDGLTDATRRLYDALDALARTLLGWIEDESPDGVRAKLSEPLRDMVAGSRRTLLRVLHYPPIGDVEPGAVRASAHEDINLITLLPAGTAPGLELLDAEGRWVAVESAPSAIVVNSGDMLALATGGYYRSTTHRVVNPDGADRVTSRYSMPLFLHPRPEVLLSPTRTAGAYLDERLAEIGLRESRD